MHVRAPCSGSRYVAFGPASTMALVAEALGAVVPGVAGTTAPDRRLRGAAPGTGRLAVELVAADRRPSTFLSKGSFHNANVALAAIGGSTNAVVRLLAIAGLLRIDRPVDDSNRIGSHVRLLVDLVPAGRPFMEDFHRAGGLLAVLREVRDLLDPAALSVTGRPWSSTSRKHQSGTRRSSGPVRRRWWPKGGTAVLRGNLAPDGGLVEPAAASPHLLRHRGRAVVFDSIEDLTTASTRGSRRRADSVLVLRGCGTRGHPGMPSGCRTCPCRRSCSSSACVTWSGSATAGCAAPPTAPSSSTLPRVPPRPRASPTRSLGLRAALHRPRAAGRRRRGPGLPGRLEGSAVTHESRCRRLTRPVGKKEFRLTRVDNEAAQEQTCEAIDRLAEALSYRTSS